jgi:hypothetical protein
MLHHTTSKVPILELSSYKAYHSKDILSMHIRGSHAAAMGPKSLWAIYHLIHLIIYDFTNIFLCFVSYEITKDVKF